MSDTIEAIKFERRTAYAFDQRAMCFNCDKRRMTGVCGSCGERVCRECGGPPTKNDPPEICCLLCCEEARDFAQWGVWGPP